MMHDARAQGNGNSLTDAFRSSAQLYHKTFPEKLANLFVTMGGERIYVAPEVADLLTENLAGLKEMVAEKAAFMRARNWGAMATEFTAEKAGAETRVNHLMLPERDVTGFVSAAYPADMNNIGVFDHEMGHFIVKGGYGADVQRAECAADAYAALRHIQRFGTATDMLEQTPYTRADYVTLYSFATHYTSAVFLEIKNILQDGAPDIQTLSLPQTAQLAADIADACALDGTALARIHDAFAPVRDAAQGEDPAKIVTSLANAMLEHKHDADIYRAGKLFLLNPKIKNFTAAAGLDDDPQFQGVLAAMAQHEKDSGFQLDAVTARRKRAAPARGAAKKVPVLEGAP